VVRLVGISLTCSNLYRCYCHIFHEFEKAFALVLRPRFEFLQTILRINPWLKWGFFVMDEVPVAGALSNSGASLGYE
jgi:hypothetical protein